MPYHGTDITSINAVLLQVGTIISQSPDPFQAQITKRLCNLIRSEAAAQIFIRLCKTQADTPFVLIRELEIPTRTTYNALTRLKQMELVVETQPLRGMVRTGAKASVFALSGYEPEALMAAMERDRLARSPAYTEVKRITQLLIDDYLRTISKGTMDQVYRAEVNAVIRRECRGVHFVDLLPLVEVELKRQGLEVL